MKFLEAVARHYSQRGPLDRTCFVFPNRRSATFFKRHLGIAAGKPLFVPSVLTIDELFSRIARREETKQKAVLLNVLHQEYVKLMPRPEGTAPESFDQFIYWGDMLLSDFDDIDKYRVDARHLLVNLRDYKAITADYGFLSAPQREAIDSFCGRFYNSAEKEDWDEANLPDGSSRPKFARLWNILLDLYVHFKQRLEDGHLAYSGMIYRAVADALPGDRPVLPQYERFVFVGLNALNECEKVLLDHLRDAGRAEFYWDYAGAMVTDESNPAGSFIRKNLKRYPQATPLDCPAMDPSAQHFEVISIPSAIGQTRKAMQILAELHPEGSTARLEETAVVLPDENLLFPMLGSIPASVENVNVTMGYSLAASSGVTLFQVLERLQQNRRERDGVTCFYHRDVVDLLEHPYVTAAAGEDTVKTLKEAILKENRIFVPADGLRKGGVLDLLFQPVLSTGAIPGYLKQAIVALQAPQPDMEREFLCQFHQKITELEEAGLDLDALLPKTWYRLLAQYVALVKIPFEGEPLKGLQVMGPLETRALDFENVIMLSVGEGTFPSRNVSNSFIPYILRKGFGLPTYEMQDAMAAYYFYRSICRARNIYLLYDSRTENMRSGEESRFIKQLRYLYPVKLAEKVATYSMNQSAVDNPLMHIEKDAAVMEKLKRRFLGVDAERSFSASSLNTYLDCPLRFYYSQVEGIQDQEEVTEDVDASLFGTIFHKVMELLYHPLTLLGRDLDKDDLSEERLFGPGLKRLEELVVKVFNTYHIRDIVGENLIHKELIVKMVRQVVKRDRQLAERGGFRILDTETDGQRLLTLGDGSVVKLFGRIDRLDRVNGRERIIDYKSGRVESDLLKDAKNKTMEQTIDEMFDFSKGKSRPGIAFQLYFYALLKKDAETCIYSLTSIFKEEPQAYGIPDDKLDYFRKKLTELIEDIFSLKGKFEPRPELADANAFNSVCKYCNFKRLCNRE